LEDFSAEGILRPTRGAIEVLDPQALRDRSVV
jgi:hypothetical protein